MSNGLFSIGWGLGDTGFFLWRKCYDNISCTAVFVDVTGLAAEGGPSGFGF